MDVHENVNAFKPHIGSPEDTINILFSSGTTVSFNAALPPCHFGCKCSFYLLWTVWLSETQGEPKAIPFSHLTPLRCIVNGWSCQDIHERDTVCWPTNLGWVMGPWLVFAALGNRARIALFQVWFFAFINIQCDVVVLYKKVLYCVRNKQLRSLFETAHRGLLWTDNSVSLFPVLRSPCLELYPVLWELGSSLGLDRYEIECWSMQRLLLNFFISHSWMWISEVH